MAMGTHVPKVIQRPHLIDGDLLAGLLLARITAFGYRAPRIGGHDFRLQTAQVRVVALREPAASQTLAAGLTRIGEILAEQRFGEGARQIEFSDPAGRQSGAHAAVAARRAHSCCQTAWCIQ